MKRLQEKFKKVFNQLYKGLISKKPMMKLDLLGLKNMDRKDFLKGAFITAAGVGASILGVGATKLISKEDREKLGLSWENYFRANYRYMTKAEKRRTVKNLERLAKLKRKETVHISDKGAIPGVLYGYAFNISKCQGYMDCIDACLNENNLDRKSNMQYIKIFEIENGFFEC